VLFFFFFFFDVYRDLFDIKITMLQGSHQY